LWGSFLSFRFAHEAGLLLAEDERMTSELLAAVV